MKVERTIGQAETARSALHFAAFACERRVLNPVIPTGQFLNRMKCGFELLTDLSFGYIM